jgi:hypothetical protein
MPVIGVLGSISADGLADILPGFREGLKDAGYIEGQKRLPTVFAIRAVL